MTTLIAHDVTLCVRVRVDAPEKRSACYGASDAVIAALNGALESSELSDRHRKALEVLRDSLEVVGAVEADERGDQTGATRRQGELCRSTSC